MTKSDMAVELFRGGFNCAQSVFSVFASKNNMDEDCCLKIASAFGGGMAHNQLTCGAVTGALMAIGMKYGKGLNDNNSKKQITYDISNWFLEKFKSQHGSIVCKDLLNGLNMNDPDTLRLIKEQQLFRLNCDRYVRDAVIIVEEIMQAQVVTQMESSVK